jgi:hypothetical protein
MIGSRIAGPMTWPPHQNRLSLNAPRHLVEGHFILWLLT